MPIQQLPVGVVGGYGQHIAGQMVDIGERYVPHPHRVWLKFE
jgi:hypothetical protein